MISSKRNLIFKARTINVIKKNESQFIYTHTALQCRITDHENVTCFAVPVLRVNKSPISFIMIINYEKYIDNYSYQLKDIENIDKEKDIQNKIPLCCNT